MRFRYSRDTDMVECEDFEGAFRISRQRDAALLYILDAWRKEVIRLVIDDTRRPICSDVAIPPHIRCPKVVVWQVAWPPDYLVPQGQAPGISQPLIKAFFEFWQWGLGHGCWIDGKPYQALVEVDFVAGNTIPDRSR